jgi:hypothetical protein
MKNSYVVFRIFIFLLITIAFSCSKDGIQSGDETGRGGVTLANSPWPCEGHDARRSSQSNFYGPDTVSASIIYDGSTSSSFVSYSLSPAFDSAGNLFVGDWGGLVKLSGLYEVEAASPSMIDIKELPAIASDGSVYIGLQYSNGSLTSGTLVAYNTLLQLTWEFNFPDQVKGGVWGAVAIGPNGSIYVVDKAGGLFAFNHIGKKIWQYKLGGSSYSSPAVANDGPIYVTDNENVIYAISPKGKLKWKYPVGKKILPDAVVDTVGTVYIGTENSLLAIANTGIMTWEFDLPGSAITRVSLANDGTAYIACENEYIYAISDNGEKKWDYHTQGRVYHAITIDAGGSLYFGGYFSNQTKIVSVSALGRFIWEYPLDMAYQTQPVIGKEKTLFVGARNCRVYKLALPE